MLAIVLRWIYRALAFLLLPVLLVFFVWRALRRPAYRDRWWERFGFVAPLGSDGREVLWVHAVSVGEAQAPPP